jgi:hypothetical protein
MNLLAATVPSEIIFRIRVFLGGDRNAFHVIVAKIAMQIGYNAPFTIANIRKESYGVSVSRDRL